MQTPLLIAAMLVATVSPPATSDSCMVAFGIDDCNGLAAAAAAAPEPTQRASNEALVTGKRNPSRFIRKFHRACRAALDEPNADLQLCFRAQLIAVERDTHWARFRAALPSCPATYDDAIQLPREPVTVTTSTTTIEIEWREPGPAGYFEHRDHPGARYRMRGEMKSFESVDPNGVRYRAPSDRTWGVQCLYDADGRLLTNHPGAGTADRATSRDFGRHMAWDVWWFHVGLRLDHGDFNGPHVTAYRRLHPVR